jgi:hypothetical protein
MLAQLSWAPKKKLSQFSTVGLRETRCILARYRILDRIEAWCLWKKFLANKTVAYAMDILRMFCIPLLWKHITGYFTVLGT